MEQADVILQWYAGSEGFKRALSGLSRPYKLISMPSGPGTSYKSQVESKWPNSIQGFIQTKLPGVRPLRVALIGFSEGCAGVREFLRCGDGGRVDAALAFDGIHTTWTDKSKTKLVTSKLAPWRAFGKLAMNEGRLCLITTSAIVPDFVSTTITSDWIWNHVTGTSEPFHDQEGPDVQALWQAPISPPFVNPAGEKRAPDGSVEFRWGETVYDHFPTTLYRRAGGLVIWNFQNLDKTGIGDHRLQAGPVEERWISEYLVSRWNSVDPRSSPCLVV